MISNNKIFKTVLILLFICLNAQILLGQKSFSYTEPHSTFEKAQDLYSKRNYSSAFGVFNQLANNYQGHVQSFSEYYAASCAAYLGLPDAILRFETFLQIYPEHSKYNVATFELGKLYLQEEQFRKAVNMLAKTDKYHLSLEEIDEYNFKYGYALLKVDQANKAEGLFLMLSNKSGQYQIPATYYYAYSAYMQNDYKTALEYFDKISTHPTFGLPSKYYMVQIHSVQKNYDEVIRLATPLINDKKDSKNIEMLRMLADAQYEKQEYSQALQSYQKISELIPYKFSHIENFQIAYCYSKNNEFEKSIQYYQEATKGDNILAQAAYNGLGESYVKTDQKKFALNSYKSAYQLKAEPTMTEESLFNYAKLSVELSYNPYNEAVIALQEYISNYPDSKNTDEAYGYLTDLYLLTKNYKNALISISNIKKLNPDMELAYSRISYYRGVELYNENDFSEALQHFYNAQKQIINNPYQANARFWIAESYYKMQKWDSTIVAYQQFFTTPYANRSEYYDIANYNEAYAFMKTKNYQKAINDFKKFLQSNPDNIKVKADANLRLADCYFMVREYDKAIEGYNNAINLKAIDSDYAQYQKAICYGVQGLYDKKINVLKDFLQTYKGSRYTDMVLFEMGLTYNILSNDEMALKCYTQMVDQYPNSIFVKKALLKIGLVHFNKGNNQKALDVLKQLAEKYSGTPEAVEALASIKSIYVEMNNIDGYIKFTQDIPSAKLSTSEQDSLTYIAAENLYMDNNCEGAVKALKNYIQRFPDGLFLPKARYYAADCMYRSGDKAEALEQYNIIVSYPRSRYTATSAFRAARLYQQDNNFEKALQYYIQVEEIASDEVMLCDALFGQIQCNYELQKYALCIQAGQKLLKAQRASESQIIETNLLMAKSALHINEVALAKTYFEATKKLSNGEKGAEAAYNIAEIIFDEEKFDECEKYLFDIVRDYASYDFWVAKSFILLADVYVEKGNIFQARQTLQSIIDNYEGQDLVNIAREKLQNLPNE